MSLSPPSIFSPARSLTFLPLAALLLAGSMLDVPTATASSLLRVGPERVAAEALERSRAPEATQQEPKRAAAPDDASSTAEPAGSQAAKAGASVVNAVQRTPATPSACAAAFHPQLKAIAEGPFQAVRAALSAPAKDAASASAGASGGMIFPPAARQRAAAEAAALRAAMAAANGTSATPPRDANARWIAGRLREDLGDFLGQGPSPYLCAGIDEYLATLKRHAARITITPERRERDLMTARAMARDSFAVALQALRPVPVPTFAPEVRPEIAASGESLRTSIAMGEPELVGPSMLVANRAPTETRISEGGGIDPDLPPLEDTAELRFESEAEIETALSDLRSRIEHALMAETTEIDATTTGSVAAPVGPMRPASEKTVLARLAEMKPLLEPRGAFQSDARTRAEILAALTDLEAVERLMLASAEPQDPLGAAFAATFEAIETAHARSCGCKP